MKKLRCILVLVILLTFIATIVFYCIKEVGVFTDYTNAYYLHKEISSMDSIDEVLKYFEGNAIPYEMSDNTLSAENGKLTYTICEKELIPSNEILIFSKLDEGTDSQLTTKTKKVNGDYVKEVSFNANDTTYHKQGDKYYTDDSTPFIVISISCVVLCLLSVIAYIGINIFDPEK